MPSCDRYARPVLRREDYDSTYVYDQTFRMTGTTTAHKPCHGQSPRSATLTPCIFALRLEPRRKPHRCGVASKTTTTVPGVLVQQITYLCAVYGRTNASDSSPLSIAPMHGRSRAVPLLAPRQDSSVLAELELNSLGAK